METIICLECGLEVEKTNPAQKYCSKECKKKHNNRTNPDKPKAPSLPTWTLPPVGCDLKLGEIANIMKEFGITFTQYERKRRHYISEYKGKNYL